MIPFLRWLQLVSNWYKTSQHNQIGDRSPTVGNYLHYIKWCEKTHQIVEETIPCVGNPGHHQSGENKLSTSVHASIHHSLLLTVDVKWPAASGSCRLNFPTVVDCHLELQVKPNKHLCPLSCFFMFFLITEIGIKTKARNLVIFFWVYSN